MTARTKKAKPEPFAHAEFLPAAYRELSAAITAVIDLEENGPFPFTRKQADTVPDLGFAAVWAAADAKAAAYQRVSAAAHVVYASIHGRSHP